MEQEKTIHSSTANREIAAVRVFDAPCELVFEMWMSENHLANWWGPFGFTITTHKFDMRPGGAWLFTMHGPDGRNYRNEIYYLEVAKPTRIVYDHKPTPIFRTTVLFETIEGKTKLTMRMLFETAKERDDTVKTYGAEEGLQQTLSRLEQALRESPNKK